MKSTATFLLLLMTGSSFGQYSRGINLAGAEFGENNLPGTFGRDYTFNSETTYRYFGAKNLNLVRLMLRWERPQPVLRGPLDANCVARARTNGDRKLIMVPGDAWSSAEQWPSVHGPTSWINDPASNFAYEAHQYFDRDNSGNYARTYDQELALNPNLAAIGPTRVTNFVNWLKTNNVRGYLGEYGIPN